MMGEYLMERFFRLGKDAASGEQSGKLDQDNLRLRMIKGQDMEEPDQKDRKQWLEEVKQRANLVEESDRLSTLMLLFRELNHHEISG